MGEHLVLRGEAHLVSCGQLSGRCIHHAPPLGTSPQSSKFLITVAVIEAPFGTLLVSPTCRLSLGGTAARTSAAHGFGQYRRPRLHRPQRNIRPPQRAQLRSTPSWSTGNQLRKVGCRASIDDPAHTPVLRIHANARTAT
jgi:hypothetical protein